MNLSVPGILVAGGLGAADKGFKDSYATNILSFGYSRDVTITSCVFYFVAGFFALWSAWFSSRTFSKHGGYQQIIHSEAEGYKN